jgi:hypothetical protein
MDTEAPNSVCWRTSPRVDAQAVEAESIQWFHVANTTSEVDLRSLGSVDYLRLEAEWTRFVTMTLDGIIWY